VDDVKWSFPVKSGHQLSHLKKEAKRVPEKTFPGSNPVEVKPVKLSDFFTYAASGESFRYHVHFVPEVGEPAG
jgi:hypothetical protein